VKKNIKPEALLFDMDGTILDAGRPITKEVLDSLQKVNPSVKKYLVTGSDMVKVENQIPVSDLLKTFDKIFTCNGTRVYNCNLDMDDESGSMEPELIHKVSLSDHYSESDINHIVDVLLRTAADTHTKIKTGTFVEWRESQINFSIVGRNCSQTQREDYVIWDNKSGERPRIMKQLRKDFQGWGLSFSLGGQISIDVTRQGWDKSYAFGNIDERPENCVFFGDRICEDGNDLSIAKKCGAYHHVDGPADIIIKLQEYQ